MTLPRPALAPHLRLAPETLHQALGIRYVEDPPPATDPPAAPERPEGVSDAEWAALGDPGKAAIVRERAARTAAEQALAATRAPKPTAPPAAPPKVTEVPKGPDGQPDIAALIQAAVTQAVAPFVERDAQREAEQAAGRLRDTVATAASARLHDPSDALAHIDLTTLTDGNGQPDPAKVTAALDDLVARKPHLAKVVDDRRHAPPGSPLGGGGGTQAPLDDRVKATLARMQASSGVKFAGA